MKKSSLKRDLSSLGVRKRKRKETCSGVGMCVWASPWAESFFGVSIAAIIYVQDFLGSQLHLKGSLRNYFSLFLINNIIG